MYHDPRIEEKIVNFINNKEKLYSIDTLPRNNLCMTFLSYSASANFLTEKFALEIYHIIEPYFKVLTAKQFVLFGFYFSRFTNFPSKY